MRKSVAIGLLILGSVAGICGISVLNLYLALGLIGVGILPAVIVTAGAAFGISRLRGVFERKYGIGFRKFFLFAYVPSAAASGIFYIVILCLDKAGYFKGFFAGMGEFLYGLAWLLTAVVAAVMGAIMLAVSYAHLEEG